MGVGQGKPPWVKGAVQGVAGSEVSGAAGQKRKDQAVLGIS